MARKQFYLFKRGGKDAPRKDGKLIFYCRFRDETGKLLSWQSTHETSKTLAELWAQAELEKRKHALPGAGVTLEDFAADFYVPGKCSYLKRQAAKGRPVSDSWAQSKRRMVVNHVFPALGRFRLAQLTRPMIERFLVDLPLSNQTRNHLLYALKTVLDEAEAEGLIARNPLEHAEPLGKKARKRDIFSVDELRRLFPSTREGLLVVWGESKYAALYLTLATTGIREGEARALRWRDVLPEGWLGIERAVKEGGEIGAPKSGDIRVTAIPARTSAVLSRWHDESPFVGANDLLFYGDSARKPLSRRVFQYILNPIHKIKKAFNGTLGCAHKAMRYLYSSVNLHSIGTNARTAHIETPAVGSELIEMQNLYKAKGILSRRRSLISASELV